MKFEDRREDFEQYYQKNFRIVVNYIARRICNHQEAEDMAMEIFTKCYERFDEFDENKSSFTTWLYVIVNNRLKNYYRDHKEHDELSEDYATDGSMEDEIIHAQYIGQMRDVLKDALSELKEQQRQVIILKYFKKLSSTEISERTGISSTNVRVLLSRGIAALKKYFKEKNIKLEL